MGWSVVYDNASGELVSVGTVVANPLPSGLTAVPISDQDAAALASGAKRWNPTTKALEPVPGWTDPAVAEQNGQQIDVALAAALAPLRQIKTQANAFQNQADYTAGNLAQAMTALNDLLHKTQTIAGGVATLADDVIKIARRMSGQLDGTT